MKFKRTDIYYKITKYSKLQYFTKQACTKIPFCATLKKKQGMITYQKIYISDLENNHRKNGKNFEKVI